MVIKKLFIIFAIILLIFPLVQAKEVDVIVHYEPLTNLVVRVLEPVNYAIMQTLYTKTRFEGNATTNFSTSRNEVAITVMIIRDGEVLETFEKLGPYYTSEPIFIELLEPDPVEEVVEEVLNENSEVNETQEEETAAITGAAITEDNESSLDLSNITSNIIYYIVALAILLGLLAFMIYRRVAAAKMSIPIQKPSEDIKITKLSEFQSRPAEKSSVIPAGPVDELLDAETKLKQAQEEIAHLKKQRQIEEAEKRLQAAESELKRLKGK